MGRSVFASGGGWTWNSSIAVAGIGALTMVLGCVSPLPARAQVISQPPAVNQEGMNNYCVFANQVYSVGAQICVPNSNSAMRCVVSEAKSAGRAFWSFDSRDWPTAPGLRCSAGS